MSMDVPEHLRTGPMAEAAKRALLDAQSMASASNSVPRISLRGREFRFIENGEEVVKFRDHIDVIIVGVEPEGHRMIKTWYEKGYQPGAKEPPSCASEDGVAPAPWVQNKQATSCQSCPKNMFGSAKSPTGKATKACRDSKRIWLRLADGNKTGDKVYEVPAFSERTLYGMNVTVASLKSFSEHGRVLAGLGQGPSVCVTRITMLDTEYPQVEFKLQAWLGPSETEQSLRISQERPWRLLTNVALALATPADEGGSSLALPGSPPALPPHLANSAQGGKAKPTSGENLDDVIGNF